MSFPIRYIHDNLVFNTSGEVWAYYKIEGFSYDFLEFEQKKEPFFRQFNFLTNIALDIHMLSIPHPTNVEGILQETMEDINLKNFELKENALEFFNKTMIELKRRAEESESSEYYDYIGVQLDPTKNKYLTGNLLLESISKAKNAIDNFDLPIYRSKELNPETDILLDDINSFKIQTRSIEQAVLNGFSSETSRVVKATEFELLAIIEKVYSIRNNTGDVKMRRKYDFGELIDVTDTNGNIIKAIRTNERNFYELQNTIIDEYESPKYLKYKKMNNVMETEELYVQYFIVSQMDTINNHPGFEWLHRLKLSLTFPVMVSISVDNVPNEVIMKRLSNLQLEIKDQTDHAKQGEGFNDPSANKAREAVQMEDFFRSTGYPSHATNFVIKVTGESIEQLKQRASELSSFMSKFAIRVVAPYGEQLKLMHEVIPGSRKKLEDYKMELESGMLAGMMFGSSTNIGDNRGFYIGHTRVFDKPVFVKPDLAAKALDGLGNVVDSLSVLVAGATGKGKSFFMNMFVYLSVMTGSKGLIIDPKGDRTGWVDGLPYIPKEFIEVWTLGSDERDNGSLDPFRTSANLEEGTQLALDILSFLTNIKVEDLGYGILSLAIEEVIEGEDPCIGEVIKVLDGWYNEKKTYKGIMTDNVYSSLEKMVTTLNALRKQQLSALLIGTKGQNFKTLSYEKPIQVLMIQNLDLAGEGKEATVPSQKISEAIMISITAWTKRYMINNERSLHKFILQDEASAVERNETGAILMDHIVRQGRYWNTTLLKGSQNATDHGSNIANMGMKFTFGLRESEEAEQMLKYFNLPVTKGNISKLINLDKGSCLFQDIYGRTAEIKIDPLFKQFLTAFNSSTATEEERQREKERQHI